MKKVLPKFFSPRKKIILIGSVLFITLLLVVVKVEGVQTTHAVPKKLRSIIRYKHKSVCQTNNPGRARCHTEIVTNDVGTPQSTNTPYVGSMGPVQFHTGYNLPCTPGGPVQSICQTPSGWSPQTIAVVVAYRAPTIENDLQVYSATYGLPSCTQANGCLRIVNQNGGSSRPPIVDSGWALETSLDIEVAHAICQTCKILLVEANSNRISDLAAAVNTAANLGATAISNSYGANEWSSETAWDGLFNHPGVAVTASSGDSGYGTSYPASSPYVVSVGGTTLQLYSDSTYASESVWSGAGSGCSSYETANTWQTGLSNWDQTNCLSKRASADVAADADPNTGASVYDSTPYIGFSGWWQVGGTSLASPIIASIFALTGGITNNADASSIIYSSFASTNSHDITTGTNGICTTSMCSALAGFDGPTGMGTPNGIAGFLQSLVSPSPTSTPTATLTPTPTSTPSPTLIPPTPTVTPTPTPIDLTPPTVSISSPANGAIVPRRTHITVTASAYDNVGVTKIQFYRNNSLICIQTTTYSCSMYTSSFRNTSVTYKAVAYDAAGNKTTTSVTVKTNP